MSENKHSTDGIAEELIRSFVQIAGVELHEKTLVEKRISELENGLIEETEIPKHIEKIGQLKDHLMEVAQIRRGDMLFLFNMCGGKGDKEQWCIVKHLAMAMYTAFECWQASNNDSELFHSYIKKNELFIESLSKFLGIEITACAACFSDFLRGGKQDGV